MAATVKIPFWNGNDTPDIIGQRIFNAIAEELTLNAINTQISDNFDNSSLDTNSFGTSLAGDGSITETTSLAINTPAANDAAIIYYKNILNPRATRNWTVKWKMHAVSMGTSGQIFFCLYQDADVPSVGAATVLGTKVFAYMTQNVNGTMNFHYYNTGGTRYFYNGSSWTTSASNAYTGTVGTTYVLSFQVNGTNLIFTVKNSDESSTLKTASIALTSLLAESGNLYAVCGDVANNAWNAEMIIHNFAHLQIYSQLSPSPTGVWTPLPVGTVLDMSTIRIPEIMNSGDAGTLKYKYAVNNGAFSSFLTQSVLQAESDPTITDATNSIQIVPQLISTGTQKTTCQTFALAEVTPPVAGGGIAATQIRRIGGRNIYG
jgi:hypothetical protein